MTPPTLDSPKEDLVIHADETLTITCRGQRTLSWVWPETTLVGEELTDRQAGPGPAEPQGERPRLGLEPCLYPWGWSCGRPPRGRGGGWYPWGWSCGRPPVAGEELVRLLLSLSREGISILECPGEPGRPYCKTLVLTGAKRN
ncbi:vascular endothelial growth factor receptor 3 [Salvelinus sp. IW2-2015]|uniref:vascular endothelial growth factor receptor 3 n=1 Tax=Salvelinus sp. IW2-2015 TaxID=2691554 RepID=UPI000CEAA4A7|nr:vascular endothelial growth factor receptor 3-like [Salvelinus alpinus]